MKTPSPVNKITLLQWDQQVESAAWIKYKGIQGNKMSEEVQ